MLCECVVFPVVLPKTTASFENTWAKLSPAPEGIVDHLVCKINNYLCFL